MPLTETRPSSLRARLAAIAFWADPDEIVIEERDIPPVEFAKSTQVRLEDGTILWERKNAAS